MLGFEKYERGFLEDHLILEEALSHRYLRKLINDRSKIVDCIADIVDTSRQLQL